MSDFPPGRPSIVEQGKAHATELAKVKTEALVVGGTFDGHRVIGGVEYQKNWKNGWGAVVYAKAWYDNKPVVPTEKTGVIAGAEITKKFGPT